MNPENKKAHYNYGQYNAGIGKNREKAVENYRQAIQIDPLYHLARVKLGACLWKMKGRESEGVDELMKVANSDSASDTLRSRSYNSLANFAFEQLNLDQAIAYELEAIRLDGTNTYALETLGDIMKEKGNEAEALMSYKKALKLCFNRCQKGDRGRLSEKIKQLLRGGQNATKSKED